MNSMDTNQKLKLLQLSLHYVLPNLRSTEIIEKNQSNLNNKNLKATEKLERVYKILGN